MTGSGRALPPTSRFADDDGSADPRLAAALAALAAARTSEDGPDGVASGPAARAALADVVTALADARVLVPVVAALEAAGSTDAGLTIDKEASTGVVALRAPDGRTALPVFSGTAALDSWRPGTRPVPAEGPRAAASALAEGWELLVVDPGGPVTAVVPRPAVTALATGQPWRPAVAGGAVRAEVATAVERAVTGVAAVRAATAEPGRRAEVAVVVHLPPGLDRAALDAVLAAVNARLAGEEVLARQVDSLEVRVRAVPA